MFTCSGSSLSLPLPFFFLPSPLLDNPSSSGGPPSHLRLFIGTPPSIFPSLTPLPAPLVSVLIRLVVSHFHPLTLLFTPYLHLFPPPLSSLHLLSLPPHLFPVFTFFLFTVRETTAVSVKTQTRARVLVNSSYDMQMRVKILTVYLTHIITRLNARAGATAAVWACACLPVNCVPAHSVLMKKKNNNHTCFSPREFRKRGKQ